MSRPGNRRSAPVTVRGVPGNRIPGALYTPQVIQTSVAAAQVEQLSGDAALVGDVNTLATLTTGLDVGDINFKLDDYEARIAALEGP